MTTRHGAHRPESRGGTGGGAAGSSAGGQAGTQSGGGNPSGGHSAGGEAGRASGGTSGGGATGSGASGGTVAHGTGGAARGGGTGTSSATGGMGGQTTGAGSGGAGPATGGRTGNDAGAGRDGGTPDGGGRGTGGAGGTGAPPATGGSSGYQPCPSSPCKILPLGDSITHGVGSGDDAGYRSQLFKLAVAANQSITFTGTLSNGPSQVSSKTFPKNHDGHDGWTVEPGFSQYDTNKNQGVSLLVSTDKAFSTLPHIVLLHIGTNDLTSSSAKSTTSDRLDSLITKIAGLAPDALIVVAKVVPLGYSSSDWDSYNAKIPTIVQAHAAKGQHVVSVDMSKLPSSQLNGVHPTDQGYATMASLWYEAIKGVLPN